MIRKKQEHKIFNKRNSISFFIAMIMVSSILAIWQGSGDPNTQPDYNGHKVTFDKTKYKIKTDNGYAFGYTYPSSLETYSLDLGMISYLRSSDTVAILFDPADSALRYIEVLRYDLAEDDLPGLGITPGFVITQTNETYSYPVTSCLNTTYPTIYLMTDNTTSSGTIYQDVGCVVLSAPDWQELVRLKDRLVYGLYGVMG